MTGKSVLASVLLVLCGMVFGATVFHEQVAEAAQAILPVRVANTPAEAVPVRGTLQPVQVQQIGSFGTGENFSSDETLYTVPAGKTLVIEAFTVLSNLNPTDNLLDARLEVELGGVTDSFDWILQPADEGVAHTGARVFRGSAQVTAYAGPGTIVEASALRNGPSLESTSVIFQIAGRLVDTP